jgi:hypothetical protein
MVGACNAITLSYRFGFNNRRRFPYLRRLASDQLCNIFCEIFEERGPGDNELADIREGLRRVLESHRGDAKAVMEAQVKNVTEKNAGAAAFAEETADKASTAAAHVIGSSPEGMAAAAVLMDQVKGFANKFLIKQTDDIVDALSETIHALLLAAQRAYRTADADGTLRTEEGRQLLREGVFTEVTSHYDNAYGQVSAHVQGLVTFLDALMANDAGNGGDD